MAKAEKQFALIIAIVAILLVASLAGNVVLLGFLNNAGKRVSAAETKAAEAERQAAAYKAQAEELEAAAEKAAAAVAVSTGEPIETVPTEETATPAPAAENTAAAATATPKPTATPTTGPYGKSTLDYIPKDDEKLQEKKSLTVISSVDLNIRSGPDTKYKQVATVQTGTEMKASAYTLGWFLVEYKNDTYGWANGMYLFDEWLFDFGKDTWLQDVSPAEEYLEQPEVIKVTAENANARSGPQTDKTLVGRIPKDTEVVWLGTDGDWRLVNFKQPESTTRVFGWIHKSNFK